MNRKTAASPASAKSPASPKPPASPKSPASPKPSVAPKVYRSIREVSAELGVKPHVLRYWESQFPSLRPKKNRAGNRIYRPEEVKLLTRIKELLYAERFTIEGARRTLMEEKKPRGSSKAGKVVAAVSATRVEAASPAETAGPSVDRVELIAERDRLATDLSAVREERERLLAELSGLQATHAHAGAEMAAARTDLETLRANLDALRADLDALRADLAAADDREKTRAAAMAVLRQELLLLSRELREESEAPTVASEPRVSVRAAEESGASMPPGSEPKHDRELELEQEQEQGQEQKEPAFPVAAMPISVGA